MLLGVIIAVLGLDANDELIEQPQKALSVGVSAKLDSTSYRPLLTLGTTTCGAPVERMHQVAKQILQAEVGTPSICASRIFGVFVGGALDVTATQADGTSRSGQLLVNATEGPLAHVVLLAALPMVTASWLCPAAFRRTPGKWLLDLKVSGRPMAKLARGAIRLSPVLTMMGLSLLMDPPIPAPEGVQLLLSFLPSIAGIGLVIWLWVKPLAADQA